MNLELGGLPWTCLEGEPTGLNWCNAADAASIYRDPPQAWLSTNGRGAAHCLSALLLLTQEACAHARAVYLQPPSVPGRICLKMTSLRAPASSPCPASCSPEALASRGLLDSG